MPKGLIITGTGVKLFLKFLLISYNFVFLHISNFITNPASVPFKQSFHYYSKTFIVINRRQIEIFKETFSLFLVECVAVSFLLL